MSSTPSETENAICRVSQSSEFKGVDWKHNCCRYSFGSYRMANIKNVYQVAEPVFGLRQKKGEKPILFSSFN
jgi:hypothetical protein